MKSALLACLALGSVHVNGEALEQLAAADPDAVSVILDTPGVQADCTVIKAAYRSAQCDCTDDNNPSTMRSLEEKLSIRVTVPAEGRLPIFIIQQQSCGAQLGVPAFPGLGH